VVGVVVVDTEVVGGEVVVDIEEVVGEVVVDTEEVVGEAVVDTEVGAQVGQRWAPRSPRACCAPSARAC